MPPEFMIFQKVLNCTLPYSKKMSIEVIGQLKTLYIINRTGFWRVLMILLGMLFQSIGCRGMKRSSPQEKNCD
jgi:hypothetical protein